jgi:hypothetical protein
MADEATADIPPAPDANPFAKFRQQAPQEANPFAKFRPAAGQQPAAASGAPDASPGFFDRLWQGMLGKDVSRAGRFGMGLANPFYGDAQIGARMAAQPGGGVPEQAMAPPGPDRTKEVDTAVQQREAGYEQRERAAGLGGLSSEWARLLGNVAGTAPLAALPTGGVGLAGRVGMGALSGALGGATAPVTGRGDFWTEKTKQMAAGGAMGGVLGGAAGTLGPKLGPDAARLAQGGVQLTPGQALGQPALERSLQAFPILRSYVQGQVGRSVADFDRAIGQQALEPIGIKYIPRNVKAGEELVSHVSDKLSEAYDRALPNITLSRDPVAQLVQASPKIQEITSELSEDHARRLSSIIKNQVLGRFDENGQMNGQVFKKMESTLSRRAASFHGTNDRELGEALDNVLAGLRAEVANQNPQFAGELQNINAGWAMYARMRAAAARRATSDSIFTPADLLQSVRTGDRSAGHDAFAKGDALLQGFARAADRVMGPGLQKYADPSATSMITGAGPGLAGSLGYGALQALQRVPGAGQLQRGAPGLGAAIGTEIQPSSAAPRLP